MQTTRWRVVGIVEARLDRGVQRLFSSFADGAPGAGLLLMRLAASACLAFQAASILSPSSPSAHALSIGLSALSAATALLLLVGLWTPVCGLLVAIAAAWHAFSLPAAWSADLLLGVLGISLSLLGPGAWSLDARLFGWRRLEIPINTGRRGADANGAVDADRPPPSSP